MAGADFGVIAAIGAGAGIAGQAMQAHEESIEEQQQEASLRLQESQTKAKAAQDQISRDKQLQQVQASQKARAVAQGMSLSSGTYNSLADASYNAFAEDTNIANLNLSNQEAEINQRMDAAQSEYHSQLWGNVFSSVGDISNLMSFEHHHGGSNSGSNDTNNTFDNSIDQTYSPEGDYEYYLRHTVEWE